MKLTALIPVHNDDYMLWFCLRSIADHFSEIIVFNDGSIDNTREVVEKVQQDYPHIEYHEHQGKPLGWAGARRKLIDLAYKGQHLFFIDADEVLCEYQAYWLQKIPEMADAVYLGFTDIWGDFNHTTHRLKHYDLCHVYVNRSNVSKLSWTMKERIRASTPVIGTSDTAMTPEPIFWHARGVKPDWRIIQRPQFNQWHAIGREGTPYDFMKHMTEPEIHSWAIRQLLSDPDHPIQPYTGKPKKPAIIQQADQRFEMTYENGQIVDRIDHGWWGSKSFHFYDDDSSTAWDNYYPRQADGISIIKSGVEYVIKNEATSELRSCNDTLAFIWSLCDADQTIGDIKRLVCEQYGGGLDNDVVDGLRMLSRLDFIDVGRW